MRIMTWNINGIRSAEKDNHLTDLLEKYNPDILCLQEIKINEEYTRNYGYKVYYNFASKKGYSGLAILTKKKPINSMTTLGIERFDEEGRFILLEFDSFYLMNIYIPHGGRSKENHPYKFESIDKFTEMIKKLDKDVIICTDFNIAHTELDVKNYKRNYDNNMFSKEERKRIDKLLDCGILDTFRVLHDEGDVYSMWPNGFDARARNMGWRIDYIFASDTLRERISHAQYLKDHLGSDHCPYLIDIDLPIDKHSLRQRMKR